MNPVSRLAIPLSNPYPPPKVLDMGNASLLPLEVWQLIFSFIPRNLRSQLKTVCKSCNHVLLSLTNLQLEGAAKALKIYHEKIFFYWQRLQGSQNKPVNWISLFEKESQKDTAFVTVKKDQFQTSQLEFPSDFTLGLHDPSIFIFQNFIGMCGFFPSVARYRAALRFFDLEKNIHFDLSLENSTFAVEKISEKAFVTFEEHRMDKDFSVRVWELVKTEKFETKTVDFAVRGDILDRPVIVNKVMATAAYFDDEKKERFLNISFFSLETYSKISEITIWYQGLNSSSSSEITTFSNDYIVFKATNHNEVAFTIYNLKSDRSFFFGAEKFLRLVDDKALFFDPSRQEIVEYHLNLQRIVLFKIKECLATYSTAENYYFVGDNQLFIYSRGQKKVVSTLALECEENEHVQSCHFVRVTSKLILLSLEIKTIPENVAPNRVQRETIFHWKTLMYKIEDLLNASLVKIPENLSPFISNSGDLFFSEDRFVEVNLSDENAMPFNFLQDVYSITSSYWGQNKIENPHKIANTVHIQFVSHEEGKPSKKRKLL